MRMTGLRAAAAAITGAAKDVVSPGLRGLALLCVLLAGAILAGAAWAAITYLVPLIPDGTGWLVWLSRGGEAAASVVAALAALVLVAPVTMGIGAALFDIAAERVEKRLGLAPGRMVLPHEGVLNGLRIALPALALNLLAAPLLFVPALNLIVFLSLNAALMSREYFLLACLRHGAWAQAQALRRRHGFSVALCGLACAGLLLVPILNLTTPLFGAAVMVRLRAALTER